VRRLVRVAALFGINENQARVALSRMAARGEVLADGAGTYTLAGRLLDRAGRLAVSRRATTGRFDGAWHVVVVCATGDSASVRSQRRAAFRAARLGELRDGLWLRPANLDVTLDAVEQSSVVRLLAVPDGDQRDLAWRTFDLAGWARRAAILRDSLDIETLDGPGSLASGFVRSAEVLRHLQRDPLVPETLLGEQWPGAALRARYEEFDAAYRALLAAAHRDTASTGVPR